MADFGTAYFYVHGPVYFYVLSGWFHLFGVSTASILVFHWLLCCIAGVFLVLFLRRINVPAYVGVLAATLFIFCFGKDLRPEPLACALAFGALLLWQTQSVSWKTFFSVFLIGLSSSTMAAVLFMDYRRNFTVMSHSKSLAEVSILFISSLLTC
jgi:hypothetical protein